MAHGDYHCCAVCDDKLSYSDDATTKEQLCPYCVIDLAKRGIFIHNGNELLAWMRATEPGQVKDVLTQIGFKVCFYDNKVDDFWGEIKEERDGKS